MIPLKPLTLALLGALALGPTASAVAASPSAPALAGPGKVPAEAEILRVQSGPDYWEVSGVPRNDRLNIRSGPSTGYRVVAQVSNGQLLRNLGCTTNGPSTWCKVQLPDGRATGWAAARFLRVADRPGRPGNGGGWGQNRPGNDNVGTPRLDVQRNGEIEVSFRRGCEARYSRRGVRIAQWASCSRAQLAAADDAVRRYLREQGGNHGGGSGGGSGGNHGGGSGGGSGGGGSTGASVSAGGSGQVGRYQMSAALRGSRGNYILTLSNGDLICNAKFSQDPTKTSVQSFPIGCSDGDKGQVVLTQNAGGYTATVNISGNKIGTITLR